METPFHTSSADQPIAITTPLEAVDLPFALLFMRPEAQVSVDDATEVMTVHNTSYDGVVHRDYERDPD